MAYAAKVPLATLGVSLLPILQKVSKNDKTWFYSKENAKEMAKLLGEKCILWPEMPWKMATGDTECVGEEVGDEEGR